jgi:MFS family permease
LRFALDVQTYLQTSLTLLLTINVCSLAGALPAGYLGDRIPKRAIMFGAFALLAGGAVLLANAKTTGSLLPLAVMLGIGWGAYYAVDWALACNLLPEGRAGALMAIWNIGASGPQVLSPAIGGIVVDRVGAAAGHLGDGYRLLFDFVGVYVVLGAVALAFVREARAGKAPGAE